MKKLVAIVAVLVLVYIFRDKIFGKKSTDRTAPVAQGRKSRAAQIHPMDLVAQGYVPAQLNMATATESASTVSASPAIQIIGYTGVLQSSASMTNSLPTNINAG